MKLYLIYFKEIFEKLFKIIGLILFFVNLIINILILIYLEFDQIFFIIFIINTLCLIIILYIHYRNKRMYEQKIKSVYKSAIIGNITQPVLHDISIPLSSLKGGLKLMNDLNLDNREFKDLLQSFSKALNQINQIIQNAQKLMKGEDDIEKFNPYSEIQRNIIILNDKIQKGQIGITMLFDENIEIRGVKTIFNRIILNVIQNAIEELIQMDLSNNKSKLQKHINIIGYLDHNFKHLNEFVLEIIDNGRGIEKKKLKKIFKSSYSLKKQQNYQHFGFGLSFVKYNMKKHFKGKVEVQSQKDQFTKFILRFPLKK